MRRKKILRKICINPVEDLSLHTYENRKTNNGFLKTIFNMKLKHQLLSLLGCATLMLASSCTDDALDNGANNGQKPEADSNVVTLTVLDGASQQGRIHTPAAPDTRALKSQRLQYVATIKSTEWQDKDHVWSATSVYIDDDTKQAYVTWHSDRQAQNPAQMWGGALDIINIANEDEPQMTQTLASEEELKFNNVTKHEGNIFLSAMHPRKGGVVARVNLGNPSQADLIGFPGSSVNAIAPNSDGKLMVVSGFKGTYGTVSPSELPTEYDYEHPENNTYLGLNQELRDDFGGKYVALDGNGDAYILRQNGETNGQIIDVQHKRTINMSVSLLSENKYAEDYDPATGNWITQGTRQSVYFGKHVMVIRNGIAYVAAGKNGIWKYDLNNNGKETKINGIFATGLYADEEFLYAATGSGLRIYKFNDETGDLPLYAFEVETYDEKDTGAPTSTTAATTGSKAPKRHSPNFVTAHRTDKGIYIYIAYGQSGVRVYKFVKEGEEQPEEPDDDDWVDIGDPEIVWAKEDLEGYYAWGEIFHAASGGNTLYEFPADEVGLDFTSPDNVTMYNNETYWAEGNGSTNKAAYTYDNYRYFTGSVSDDGEFVKFTKYSFDEGGKTVLDPEDDVATMRLGNGWRMPTKDEWQRLLNKIDAEKSTETEEGLTLYFKGTEASLFFPPTGLYKNQTEGKWDGGGYYPPTERVQIGFYYWSSTLCDQENSYQDPNWDRHQYTGGYVNGKNVNRKWCKESLAWFPDFNYYRMNGYDRCFGMKVRPVKDKANIPEFANQEKQ